MSARRSATVTLYAKLPAPASLSDKSTAGLTPKNDQRGMLQATTPARKDVHHVARPCSYTVFGEAHALCRSRPA